MRNKYLTFGAPRIEEDEIQSVVDTMRSGWIGTGPKVAIFEKEFSKYIGTEYAVAVNSCTAALHLSILALEIGSGHEVIVPVLTFAATANAVIHSGAKPVFVDVNKENFCIDVSDFEKKITPQTKAVILVHFAGYPCNYFAIKQIADKFQIKIIHDCAHAIETEIDGKKVGSYNDIACFSFYVTKNITTAEGGMITTNDQLLAARLKILALHGMDKDAWKRFSDDGYKHYEIVEAGFKYNMTDIQASIGLIQLQKIEQYYKIRKNVWDKYQFELSGLPFILPQMSPENTRHGLHLFSMIVDLEKSIFSRDQIIKKLHEMNIGSGVHYIALHYYKYYQGLLGNSIGDFPNAEFISNRTISIPFSSKINNSDIADVCEAFHTIF